MHIYYITYRKCVAIAYRKCIDVWYYVMLFRHVFMHNSFVSYFLNIYYKKTYVIFVI